MVDFCCKYCGSTNIVRYGQSGGVQYWWCKDCKRKFADNDALPDMKTPIMQIGATLSMYYRGMSIDEIRYHLDQQYNNCPSGSTIYDWICRFTDEATVKTRDYHPNVGDTWVADETVLFIGGKRFWLIDVIDYDTRYLLATRLSWNRGRKDIALLLREAYRRADKAPKLILTDGWMVYPDAVDLVFGAKTKHIASTPFVEKDSTNIIERFQGSLKDRTKVMRGMKKPETAVLDGWLTYYNFFRPHESLGDKTPAEKAGLNIPLKNWLDVVKQSKGAESYTSLYPIKRVIFGSPTKYPIRRSKRKRKVVKQSREVMPTIIVSRLTK